MKHNAFTSLERCSGLNRTWVGASPLLKTTEVFFIWCKLLWCFHRTPTFLLFFHALQDLHGVTRCRSECCRLPCLAVRHVTSVKEQTLPAQILPASKSPRSPLWDNNWLTLLKSSIGNSVECINGPQLPGTNGCLSSNYYICCAGISWRIEVICGLFPLIPGTACNGDPLTHIYGNICAIA